MSVLVCIAFFKYIWIKYFYNEIAYVAHTFNQPVTWSEKYALTVIEFDPIAIPIMHTTYTFTEHSAIPVYCKLFL